MASAAGRRGDTRIEPDVRRDYQTEKAALRNLIVDVPLAENNRLDFLRDYKKNLKRQTRKFNRLGTRLQDLLKGRYEELEEVMVEVERMNGSVEVKREICDNLLRYHGVHVSGSDWEASECTESTVGLNLTPLDSLNDMPLGHQVDQIVSLANGMGRLNSTSRHAFGQWGDQGSLRAELNANNRDILEQVEDMDNRGDDVPYFSCPQGNLGLVRKFGDPRYPSVSPVHPLGYHDPEMREVTLGFRDMTLDERFSGERGGNDFVSCLPESQDNLSRDNASEDALSLGSIAPTGSPGQDCCLVGQNQGDEMSLTPTLSRRKPVVTFRSLVETYPIAARSSGDYHAGVFNGRSSVGMCEAREVSVKDGFYGGGRVMEPLLGNAPSKFYVSTSDLGRIHPADEVPLPRERLPSSGAEIVDTGPVDISPFNDLPPPPADWLLP